MPAKPLFDLAKIDTSKVIVDLEGVMAVNPQRYEFQQLHGLYYYNPADGEIAGFRDVRDDEFWVRGHIPGRPLFPGVLMIETAAQLVSYYAMSRCPEKGFLGFGGVGDVKFRGAVTPGRRILMIAKEKEFRERRCAGMTQAYVDGKLVYEGLIAGMWV